MAEPLGPQLPAAGPVPRWASSLHRVLPPSKTRMKMMTVAEIATEMRVSRGTVYRLIHGYKDTPPQMAHVRVGNSIRVSEYEFMRYIQGEPPDHHPRQKAPPEG